MFESGGEKCEKGLTIGTEIGMSFKLPDVMNSIFGSANKLCGVIPMLLPYGHYKQPALLNDPERFEKFLRPLLAEYADLFPNDMDDEILEKMRTSVRAGAQMYPRQEFDTPNMKLLVAMAIISIALDDIYDSQSDKPSYSDGKKMSEMLDTMLSGIYTSASEIPLLVPAFEPISHQIFKVIELSKQLIPGYTDKNKWYRIELDNGMRGNILLQHTDGDQDGKTSYSPSGRAFFGGYQNGMIQIIEHTALLENIQLDDKIRSDIVFQKLKADVGIAGYALNDVYGIVRDIEKKQSRDTNILINVMDNQILLQDAFDISLKTMTDAMSDAKISIKLLKDYYSDDQQLLNYISCLQEAIDGQIYSYARVTRYGETNSKIVALQ